MQFSLLSVSVVLFASQTVLASTPYYRSDARCGKDFGGALCNPNGEYGGCCSRYGYCGKTADYCLPSNDCQSGCSAGTKTLKTSVTTLMTLTRTSSSTAKVTPTTTSSTVASVKASTTSATTTPSSTPKPSNKKFTVSSISATYVPSGGVPGGGTRTASCIVSFPVVDQSTSASTTCSLTWNPETTTPKDLVACDDASFKFNFPVLTGCSDFSIHVEHATNGVTNKGTTPEWSRNLYPDGSHTLCSGTAVCTVSWSNDTSPLVAPFA